MHQLVCPIMPLLHHYLYSLKNQQRSNIKMILLWIILLLLHQGYALIPVTTVQLGESVTFSCFFADSEYSNKRVKWYKQTIGDTLTLITTLMKATERPTFEQGFLSSRFDANHSTTMSTLTISKTIQEDEAVYHCGVSTWSKDQWSATYLSLKGNIQRTSDFTVVQSLTASDPVHPGDSVTLQCSVLSGSQKKSCPGEHSVHWFGVMSDKSHSNIMYTDGKRRDECEEEPDASSPQKSCVYRFSKNVSSSDAGTYYCAVATCGEILFGNGTKLDIKGSSLWSTNFLHNNNILWFLLCGVLAVSVIVIAFLIYAIKKTQCDHCNNKAAVSLQEDIAKRNLKRDPDKWIYSAAVFTLMKTGSGGKKNVKSVDRERIYAAVKAFGLD